MALGNERFFAEFKSDQGVQYKLSIYDEDYIGATSEFVLADGFKLKYRGENAERYQAIKTSSVDFTALAKDGLFLAFLTELRGADQSRFKIKIQRDEGSGYSNFWHGVLLPDIGKLADEYIPQPVKFRAVDGLSLMKKIDFNRDVYDGTNGDPKSLYTFIVVLMNMFKYYNPTSDFFTAGVDNFFRTYIGWYEDSMATPGQNLDPLKESAIYPEAFIDEDDNGVREALSAYHVIEQICECWGMRLFQSDGIWHFIQSDAYRNSPIYYRRYLYDTSSVAGSSSLTLNKTLGTNPQTQNILKLSGSKFGYFPKLQKVKAKYGKWTSSGMYGDEQSLVDWNSFIPMQSNLINLGYVEAITGSQINIQHRYKYRFTGTYNSATWVAPVIKVRYMIRIGTQYYNGTDWTTTASFVEQEINPVNIYIITGGWQYSNAFSITTTDIPASGDLEYYAVKFISSYTMPNFALSNDNEFDVTILENTPANPSVVQYMVNGSIDVDRVFASTDNNTNANDELDLGELRIGDGPTTSAPSWGRIRVHEGGGVWSNGNESNWQAWGSGTSSNITQILTDQCLQGQRKFIEKNDYKIFLRNKEKYNFYNSLDDGLREMIPNGYKFDALNDEISGQWFESDGDSTGISNTAVSNTQIGFTTPLNNSQ